MKVLLTGTIRVGKTTLLNRLRSEGLNGCVLIDEVARELLEKKPELEKNANFQDLLFKEQTEREMQAVSTGAPIIICDRGCVDIVAYSRLFEHPVKHEWLAWCRSYDKVFMFNKDDVSFTDDIISVDPQYDRGRDWIDFRDRVERQIMGVLSDFRIPYVLLSGSTDQRFLSISKEMGGFGLSLESGFVQRERGIR